MAQIWIQHTFSRKRFHARGQAATLAILGVAVLMILGSVYLSQVASFAITNRAIEDLIIRRDELKYINERLIAEIAQHRTAPRLLQRAQDIGFRPATNDDIDYVLIEGYSPSRRNSFADATSKNSQADAAPVYDETFHGWLQRQLTLLRDQIEAFGR